MLVERFGWIFEMRFCARKIVRKRGWRGKLPSCAMSLSVRSIASLSCATRQLLAQRLKVRLTNSCCAHVLNGGNLVA